MPQNEKEAKPFEPMPKPYRLGIGLYILGANLLIVYLLLKMWRIPSDPASPCLVSLLPGGRWLISMPPDRLYLMIVVLAGALGSYAHLSITFSYFVGQGKLERTWAWWYFQRPFIGITLAVILYFALRGGLLVGVSQPTSVLSPYGVGAIAGLAGLFSKLVTDKLRQLFRHLFSGQEKQS
jgi:hypothetical protein